MDMIPLAAGVALAGLVVATYSDMKTREVPDWINYGMIFAGLGIRAIYSVAELDYTVFLHGILGLAIFFLIASLMYYAGQWGGGDAKMLMGVGALMGLTIPKGFTIDQIPDLIIFWFLLLLAGAVYGLGVSLFLSIKHADRLAAELMPTFKNSRMRLVAALLLGAAAAGAALFVSDAFSRLLLTALAAVAVLTYVLWAYVRAVENACMLKDLPIGLLREGDWIAEDVIVDKKRICGPKDLGIEKKQIELLKELAQKGKVKTVRVKEGIPFLPPFLIAFVLTWLWPIKQVVFPVF